MNLFNSILVGFKEIWAHKFRSLLTMLGIILGVASLVAMSALVKGMENGMKEALIALGGLDKVLTREQQVPAWQQHLADQAPGRTLKDVYALKRGAPLIRLVSPEMALTKVILTRGEKRVRPSEFVGAWPEVLEMNLHVLEHGRFFNELDAEQASAVCVIGTGIRDELFGSPAELNREINPVGERININGQTFTIIGMFQHYESEKDRKLREQAQENPEPAKTGVKRGRPGYGGGRSSYVYHLKNYVTYVPLNTMWVRFRSASGTNSVPDATLSDIDLKVVDLEHMDAALKQAQNVLNVTHNGIEDFTFSTQEGNVESINSTISNARLSGGFIAAISLLVGGIGIMNIMLASITERIREIGIRKAIGATPVSIFMQTIVESVVISVVGGVAGMATSFGLVQFLIYLTPTENTPVITLPAMLVAFAFSAAIGMVAGLYPAFKAARLDPIQALRYE